MKLLSLTERLGLVAYRNQGRSEARAHIEVETDICNSTCPHKCTTWVCPANPAARHHDGFRRRSEKALSAWSA